MGWYSQKHISNKFFYDTVSLSVPFLGEVYEGPVEAPFFLNLNHFINSFSKINQQKSFMCHLIIKATYILFFFFLRLQQSISFMRNFFGNFSDNQLKPNHPSTLESPYQKPFPTSKNTKVRHLRTIHSGLSVMKKGGENHFQGLFLWHLLLRSAGEHVSSLRPQLRVTSILTAVPRDFVLSSLRGHQGNLRAGWEPLAGSSL